MVMMCLMIDLMRACPTSPTPYDAYDGTMQRAIKRASTAMEHDGSGQEATVSGHPRNTDTPRGVLWHVVDGLMQHGWDEAAAATATTSTSA